MFVLIADGDRGSADTLGLLFRSLGLTVGVVYDGEEAWKALENDAVDAMVLDVLLPRRSGLDLCESIRSQAKFQQSAIFLTNGSYQHTTLAERVLDTFGIRGLFRKPLRYDLVLEGVVGAIGLQGVSYIPEQDEEVTHWEPPVTLAEILITLFWQRGNGVLTLEREESWKRVTFVDGLPVRADSSLRSESLGQHLLRNDRLDPLKLQATIDWMMEHQVSMTEALPSLGIMNEREIYAAIKAVCEERLVGTFNWEFGQARFISRQEMFPAETIFPINLFDVYRRGLATVLPEQALQLKRRHAASIAWRPLPYWSVGVSQFALDEGKMQRLLRGGELSDEELLILLTLRDLSMVEEARAFQKTFVEPPAQDHVGSLAQLEKVRVAPGGEIENLVLSAYVQMRGKNYFEILGVTQEASIAEIKAAYHKLAKVFHPDRYRKKLVGETLRIGERVFGQMVSAYEVLSDADARRTYLEKDLPKREQGLEGWQSHREGIIHAEAIFLKGDKALQELRYGEAKQLFEEAVQENPHEPQYALLLAWVEYCTAMPKDEGKRNTCKEKVYACLKGDPHLPRAHLYLGILLAEEGQSQGAIHELQIVLQRQPKHPKALEALRLTLENRDQPTFCLSDRLFPRS